MKFILELFYLNLTNHLVELFDLVLAEVSVVLDVGDVQLVLGLGLRGLERASQDGQLDVFQYLKGDKKSN